MNSSSVESSSSLFYLFFKPSKSKFIWKSGLESNLNGILEFFKALQQVLIKFWRSFSRLTRQKRRAGMAS